ncbi:MAG: lipase family protein [Janthinobacterium lividum]
MKLSKKSLLLTTLALGASFYSIVQAHNNDFGHSDFIAESRDNVMPAGHQAKGFGFGLDIDEDYLGQPAAVKSELDQPARTHKVTKNISLDDVKRAAYMADIAYEGYAMPLNAKVHEMGEKSKELMRAHFQASGQFEDGKFNLDGMQEARSKIHFFGQNGQKDGAIIEDTDGKIYVSYRGTIGELEDWGNNLNANKRTSKIAPDLKDKDGNAVYFHSGFLNRFESTFDEINSILNKIATGRGQDVKDLPLTITGHSKGGAIAQDAAILLNYYYENKNIRNITFAAARSMNHAGANVFNEQL